MSRESSKQLIFVYNANSGLASGIVDSLHKTFMPSTYQCDLCALTYGSVRMKKQWKDFVRTLSMKVIFLHRDEFARQHPDIKLVLPTACLKEDGRMREVISAQQFATFNSLEDLIEAVKKLL